MRILLADDDSLLRDNLSQVISEDMGHEVVQCANGKEALDEFMRNPYPMVLSDIRMPYMDGIELLRKLKETPGGDEADFVMMTAYTEVDHAIAALRAGAYDYLHKPVNFMDIKSVIERVMEHQALRTENQRLTTCFEESVERRTRETRRKLEELQKAYSRVLGIGEIGIFAPAMQDVMRMAEKLHRDRTVPVLIEGETGTGKELVARAIHYGEGDETSPFIDINCTAVTPNLFDSELFGYEGGAFTGARQEGMEGKFEAAQGGTIFFDEIGDLPLELQPKLLRVLQQRQFFRVGGLKKINLDVRVICATNMDLEQMIREGSFREDLFFRLDIGRIRIPPLRERPEDIEQLAAMFMKSVSREKEKNFTNISANALEAIKAYSWPGNVRELKNTIEKIILWYDDSEIRPEHLLFLGEKQVSQHNGTGTVLDPENIKLPPGRLDLGSLEDAIIRKAYQMFNCNKTKTAEYLGLSRGAVQRRLSVS